MRSTIKFGGFATPVEAKTAAYTLKERDCGKLFTNRGASAGVTFTLPKIGANNGLKGLKFEFFSVAAQVITVASDPADSIVADSDAAADTIALAGTIGQHLTVVCDGTSWLAIPDPSGASAATGGATNPRAVTIVS